MGFVRKITIVIFVCAVVLWGIGKVHILKQDREAPVMTLKKEILLQSTLSKVNIWLTIHGQNLQLVITQSLMNAETDHNKVYLYLN